MLYIYEHIRPDTNAVFYVGKGTDNRMHSKHRRNAHWNSIVRKAGGFTVREVCRHEEEEVARSYRAALDSCDLLNAGKPKDMTDADWADTVKRNKEHLKIMLAKDCWTTEDLTPLRTASA